MEKELAIKAIIEDLSNFWSPINSASGNIRDDAEVELKNCRNGYVQDWMHDETVEIINAYLGRL